MREINFPLTVKAIRVVQSSNSYFVTVLPASVVLDVAYSDVLSARRSGDSYELDGTQRALQRKRLQMIADYIDRDESAFPNSIILAVNYRKEDGLLEDDEPFEPERKLLEKHTDGIVQSKRWEITESSDGCHSLTIPTRDKLAAIIDGQHRLFAFTQTSKPSSLDRDLICSVFLDLPKPFQAQLFATINSTQKPVDKSLTYELFGYNVEEEHETFWSPDKLAVFLTRRLATDAESPLRGRIAIAPVKDAALTRMTADADWHISMAVVVEGILRLFSSNPKKDNTNLLDDQRKERSALISMRKDKSPLREADISSQDSVIYTLALNYLRACDDVFWKPAKTGSFIVKTVGVQALFDVLRKLAAEAYEKRDIRSARFIDLLEPAKDIDFSDDQYRNASGSGRSLIRNAILAKIGG